MISGQPTHWQEVDLPAKGKTFTFQIQIGDHSQEAFLVHISKKQYRAFLNHCPHAGTTLDWLPGQFFDDTGCYLQCQTHGAQFDPDTGECVLGPAISGLTPLPVRVKGDKICVPAGYDA